MPSFELMGFLIFILGTWSLGYWIGYGHGREAEKERHEKSWREDRLLDT